MEEVNIRVLKIEPGKAPVEVTIPNTLRALQDMVDGLIEIVDLDQRACLICNEEGKILGMEGNRRVGSDIIAGTFLVTGADYMGNIRSLTDNEMQQFTQRFAEPESFAQEELQASSRMELFFFR